MGFRSRNGQSRKDLLVAGRTGSRDAAGGCSSLLKGATALLRHLLSESMASLNFCDQQKDRNGDVWHQAVDQCRRAVVREGDGVPDVCVQDDPAAPPSAGLRKQAPDGRDEASNADFPCFLTSGPESSFTVSHLLAASSTHGSGPCVGWSVRQSVRVNHGSRKHY